MAEVKIAAGLPIREWLYAGPFEKDVSELYQTNYDVPAEPYLPLAAEALDAVRDCLPEEGDSLKLMGQTGRWTRKRLDPSESKLTWARYGTFARFLVTAASTRIAVRKSGAHVFSCWLSGGGVVLMNGREVFRREAAGRVEGSFRFRAELREGINHCMVLLFNAHLHCTNSFMLILEDAECAVRLPLVAEGAVRERIEEDISKFYLMHHVLESGDYVTVALDEQLLQAETWLLSITPSSKGVLLKDKPVWSKLFSHVAGPAQLKLCLCSELDGGPGEYSLRVDYIHADGRLVEGVRYTFYYAAFVRMSAAGGYEERRNELLQAYAASRTMDRDGRNGAYHALVRLLADSSAGVDEDAVRDAIRYINARYDCADFALHGLLRLYWRFRNTGRLPVQLAEEIKECILGFKYWEDEPGRSMMFTRSENHEILFFSAEYLAGLLFPCEIFTNSNLNGLFHIQKGKAMVERWIKEKGMYGFMEWHSNTYYEEDLLALLNIVDMGEANSSLRIHAQSLADLIAYLIATHSYKGVMGTTHGRCYEESVLHPELEAMSHINRLLVGAPRLIRENRLSMGAVLLMDSSYRPDPVLEQIALSTDEWETRTRMGLFPHEGMGGVNCSTFRTKDYMVSGLVESHQGRFGHQVQAGQVLLDGNLPVFVTCFDNKSETTRPSYWGGQYRMPKTVAVRNVLAYIYRVDEAAGCTHCYFPADGMDEVSAAGKWLFGRKHEAYIAVYSLKPWSRTMTGRYKNKELLCLSKSNIWLLEAGSRREYGSFQAFVQAVSQACLEELAENILYVSPSVGRMELGWDRVCTVDGNPALDGDFPLIHNHSAYGEYGSGRIILQLENRRKILNFIF